MLRVKKPLFFYGWTVVAVSFVTLIVAYGMRYSFSVVYVHILDEFGWSRADTAIAFSINMIIYGLVGPVAGSLIDRFGPRRVLPVGAVICGLGALGISQISNMWQLCLFYAILAAGIGLIGWVSHAAFLPNWFSYKLGTAVGIAMAGASLGNALSIPIQILVSNYGWRGAYVFLAIGIVAIIVPLTTIFQRHRAQDKGLMLDGITNKNETPNSGETVDNSKRLEELRIVDKEWASTEWTLARSLRTYRFWVLGIASMFSGFQLNMMLVHLIAFLVGIGYDPIFAASIFALVGSLSIASIIGGVISDRLGREWSMTLGTSGICLGILLLILAKVLQRTWLIYLFAVLYGTCYGIDRPSIIGTKADIFKGKHFGKIVGFNNLGYGFGSAIGPWLGGYIYDISNSYQLAFLIASLAAVGNCLCYWIAAPRKVRMVGGKVRRQNL